MRIFILSTTMLAAGCSEYEMSNPSDYGESPTENEVPWNTGTGNGGGDGGGGELTNDDGDGDGGRDPDPLGDVDCPDGEKAVWLSGEIYRLGSDDGPAVGQLDSPVSGMFHMYDLSIAESGDAQWNESAYIRIPNASQPSGLPLDSNCGDDYVVVDADNWGPVPAGSTQYLGTFWISEGINDVEMWHYCPRFLDGECGDLHITDNPDSTCDTGNANSVHFTGEAVCLVPAN